MNELGLDSRVWLNTFHLARFRGSRLPQIGFQCTLIGSGGGEDFFFLCFDRSFAAVESRGNRAEARLSFDNPGGMKVQVKSGRRSNAR